MFNFLSGQEPLAHCVDLYMYVEDSECSLTRA